MVLTSEDKKWLGLNYPLLKITKSDSREVVIEGKLDFRAIYDSSKDQYIFNPDTIPNKKYYIADSYTISILSPVSVNVLPIVIETGGRIFSIAKARSLRTCDLHIDDHGICCLFPKHFDTINYAQGIGLKNFIYDLVVPFFYSQSFFEKYGDWPTGAYSHGDLGTLEYYNELASAGQSNATISRMFLNSLESKNQKIITNSIVISRQWQCLCGKGAKFRHCHPRAMDGLRRLKADQICYEQKQKLPEEKFIKGTTL